jgi:serine/threonine protein kinase/tetratricopeptide (TPR) repeat protein
MQSTADDSNRPDQGRDIFPIIFDNSRREWRIDREYIPGQEGHAMTVDPKHVQSVFLSLAEVAAADRPAALDRACGDDVELRQRVEALLKAHDAPGSLLDEAALSLGLAQGPAREPEGANPPVEAIGTKIGPYQLLQKLGEGGMGAVWVAEQNVPVKRRVALKVIKPGMDSAQVLRRFEAERQALALMDHTNIAKVFDGGATEAGRPYFVMELVKGVPITRYCNELHLPIRERLELFIPICQAIQHAHQKGIIHRDIKPSNVLVCMQDGRPVSKVIDFGVAKATSQRLTEESMYTEIGQVIGTLEYMAPEQAELRALDIDTRADVYALGVLLYELLTGTTPLCRKRLKEAAFAEMLRIIREEEPQRPSTRLTESQDSLVGLAAQRRTEPAKLARAVRGELDWIAMRCLEKDRTRRYETASALARDIERHLTNEPVEACPPRASYRLRKFLRRNRGPVLAGTVVLLALVLGVAGTTFGLVRAERQRREAERAREDAAMQRDLAQANETKALTAAVAERQAKVREAEQRTRAEKAFKQAREALDAMTSAVAEASLSSQREISGEQKKLLGEALIYYKEFAGRKADDEQSRARTAEAAYRVGQVEHRLGHMAEAAAAFRQACEGFTRLAAEFPAVADYRQKLARSHLDLGVCLTEMGRRPEAESQYQKGLQIQEKLAADFPTVQRYQQDQAATLVNLGSLLKDLGKRPQAEEHYRKALTLQEKLAGEPSATPEARMNLALIHSNLGVLLSDLGKRAEAEEQYRKGLAIQEKLVADFPALVSYQVSLAGTFSNLGVLIGNSPAASGQSRDKQREYADRAMALLQQAVKAGFRDAGLLTKERAFDSLRDRDDFKKLMMELNAKGPGKP